MVPKTGAENRGQSRLMASVYGTCVMGLRVLLSNSHVVGATENAGLQYHVRKKWKMPDESSRSQNIGQ